MSDFINIHVFEGASQHFHQGLETQRWIISELWSEYVRLRDMIAFPDTTECNGHHYDMQKHIITTVLGHIYDTSRKEERSMIQARILPSSFLLFVIDTA